MSLRGRCVLLLLIDVLLGGLMYIRIQSATGSVSTAFYPLTETVSRDAGEDTDSLDRTETERDVYQEVKPKVALTYDDGPHPYYTDQILDILAKKGVKASFFVIGKNVKGNEKVLQRMQREGHLICNHTYDHVDLCCMGEADACMQLCMTSDIIENTTGVRPMFFRPPFGEWKKILAQCTDMLPVLWTLDTRDWLTKNSEQSYRQVEGHVKENDIILMHDYYQETIQATESITDYLLEQGYDLVTVEELILE